MGVLVIGSCPIIVFGEDVGVTGGASGKGNVSDVGVFMGGGIVVVDVVVVVEGLGV